MIIKSIDYKVLVCEVYISSFPIAGGRVRVSTNGGVQPRWRGDGKELFYLSLDQKMMAVPVNASSALDVGIATAVNPSRNDEGTTLRPPRALDKGMKPVAADQRLRRQRAELAELRNHVRLIGISQIECDPGPVDLSLSVGMRQTRMKSCQPAIQFRWDPEVLAKLAREMLPGRAGVVGHRIDRHAPAMSQDVRGYSGHVDRTLWV